MSDGSQRIELDAAVLEKRDAVMTHKPPEGRGKEGPGDEWIESRREGRRRSAPVPRLARVNFFPTSAVRGAE